MRLLLLEARLHLMQLLMPPTAREQGLGQILAHRISRVCILRQGSLAMQLCVRLRSVAKLQALRLSLLQWPLAALKALLCAGWSR